MAIYISIDNVVYSEQDGSAVFTVSLDNAAPAGGVTIQYSTADGTTSSTSDYTSTSGALVIAEGSTTGAISIPITNDATLEQVKGFLLNLATSTPDAVLARTSVTALLMDNDAASGTPNVSASDVVVDESTGFATVVISLDKPSTGTVTVNYATQAATAVAGDDYTDTSGTVTFAAGETVKTVTVAIVNDAAAEVREVLALALTGASGATISDPRAHIVIQANDATAVATPTINVQGSTVVEGAGFVDFIVTLSAPGTGAVSVTYGTADGTALAGSDYIAASGTLTFAPGETSKTVRVLAGDNATVDGSKSFSLTLSTPSGGALGVSTASGVLVDDESPAPTTSSRNIITAGSNQGEVLGGTLYIDELRGGSGSDLLDGRAENDYMYGYGGDDVYIAEENGGDVWEPANAGNDTIISYLNTTTLAANFENLVLGGAGNLNGTGNTLANSLRGNSGNNQLSGGDGNDTLDGGVGGTDTLVGGAGDDTYRVASGPVTITEAAGGGTDVVQASVTHTLAAEVENLVLTGASAIDGTGNDLDNTLTGNAANNRLTGAAGNDTLDGGLGDDTLTGGSGDDVFHVDSSADVVIEATAEGTDVVRSSVTYTLGANLETLVLTGSATVDGTGNTLANELTGNAAANNLNGKGGADTMSGGAGNDRYYVDNAGDSVIELAGGGTDTVVSTLAYTLDGYAENLTLLGNAIEGAGNGLNNVITGNAQANVLTGGAGLDTLTGGVGADTLVGGSGSDKYYVDNAGDVITELFHEGADAVVSTVSYTLGDNLEALTLTGASSIDGTGNDLANTLTGNSAANRLEGGDGADTLTGGAGADTLVGGLGNDKFYVDDAGDGVTEALSEGTDLVVSSVAYTLSDNVEKLTLTGSIDLSGTGNDLSNVITGNVGANVLIGLDGGDSIKGGAGADTLIGGAGRDVLYGGTGADQFVFDSLAGGSATADVVTDFDGTDTLAFDADVFTALGAVGTLSGALFVEGAGVTGPAVGQTAGLYYNVSNGALYYDADGYGGASATKVATLSGAPDLEASDIVIV